MFIDTLTNAAHMHLLLNHVPTLGFAIGLVLFLVGVVRGHDDLKRTGLAVFVAVAVLSIATYVTGNAAEDVLRGGVDVEPAFPAGVLPQAIRAHEDAALPAFLAMEVTGFAAWLVLWRWRATPRLANSYFTVVLVLAVVTWGLMARAAELGGQIHHVEIRAPSADVAGGDTDDEAADASGTGWTQKFGTQFVVGQKWVWPTLETVHFIGLCLLFTSVILVNLRMLGVLKGVSSAALHQVLPLGMLGFGLNLISGMMFFIGVPGQYVENPTFFWKIALIVLGGLNVLLFMLDERVWSINAGDDAPLRSKIAAGSALGIWAGVLFCGHMLPFIGGAF